MMRIATVSIVAFLSASNAFGADLSHCWSGNTLEINECMAAVLDKAEKDMVVAYESTLKQISQTPYSRGSEPQNEKLRTDVSRLMVESQNEWLKFRKADCAVVYQDSSTGSVRNMIHLQCLIARTEQRTIDLRKWRAWQY